MQLSLWGEIIYLKIGVAFFEVTARGPPFILRGLTPRESEPTGHTCSRRVPRAGAGGLRRDTVCQHVCSVQSTQMRASRLRAALGLLFADGA